MEVRLATRPDAPRVKALLPLVYAAFGEASPGDAQLAAFLESALADPTFEFVVAEENGALVGILSLAYCPTSYRASRMAFLDDFHVLEAARGRGVGRAMLSFAADRATERGAVELKLLATPDDRRLRRIYFEAGFREAPLKLHVLALDVPGGRGAA